MASADRARRSAHEVSIDEELVNLMAFQRMYEAAARVITTVDEALDVLINRTGIVGR
jgi:flagellar hook-associated protein 1 FlgK